MKQSYRTNGLTTECQEDKHNPNMDSRKKKTNINMKNSWNIEIIKYFVYDNFILF